MLVFEKDLEDWIQCAVKLNDQLYLFMASNSNIKGNKLVEGSLLLLSEGNSYWELAECWIYYWVSLFSVIIFVRKCKHMRIIERAMSVSTNVSKTIEGVWSY